MGNPAPGVNNWPSWGPSLNENVFGDMMSQRSMSNSAFMKQPTSSSQQFFDNPSIAPGPSLGPSKTSSKSRSDVSSVSNDSPENRLLGDDFLSFDAADSVTPISASSSRSPANRISSPSDNNSTRIKKRTLNTLAARRYRQKRVDQMAGLEITLKETETERDELKIKVARLEAEVEVLRRLVGSGNGQRSSEKS